MGDPVRFAQSDLATEISAVELLKEHVRAIDPDDADLLRDAIEGETDFFAAVDRCALEAIRLEVEAKANKEVAKAFSEAGASKEKRKELLRVAILAALRKAAQHKTPSGLASLSAKKASIIISEESQIPSQYFDTPPVPEPVVNKERIREALTAGEKVAGAALGDDVYSLTIRKNVKGAVKL